jgi:hypothetical protein
MEPSKKHGVYSVLHSYLVQIDVNSEMKARVYGCNHVAIEAGIEFAD